MFDKHADEAIEIEIWLKAEAKGLELQKKTSSFLQKKCLCIGASPKICRGRGG